MKFLTAIFNIYIKASLHVAVAVFLMFQITKVLLNNSKIAPIDFFVFFSTIVGYNFLKYKHLCKSEKIFSEISIKTITFLAFCGLLFCLLKMNLSEIFIFLPVGIVVAVYPKIRKNAFLKTISVAVSVTFVTVFIPFYNLKQINIELVYTFLQRFLLCLIWLIPFEIIDSKSDQYKTKTIVCEFGVSASKKVGYLLVVFSFFLELFVDFKIVPTLILITSAFGIFFCNENRSKYYSLFWIEAIPILWWILICFEIIIKIS
jgi:hypothetical protein